MENIQPEYLLNMAWLTTGDYLSFDINYKFLNAGIELIENFYANGGKQAVYAGTCFEYKIKDSAICESEDLETNKTAYTFANISLEK